MIEFARSETCFPAQFNCAPTDGRIAGNESEVKTRMPLTRSFETTLHHRVQTDPDFRNALLNEGVEFLLAGDVAVGKSVLRDYINATIGFEELADKLGAQPETLMRMFGPSGNPTASNLGGVIAELQRSSGVHRHVNVDRSQQGD